LEGEEETLEKKHGRRNTREKRLTGAIWKRGSLVSKKTKKRTNKTWSKALQTIRGELRFLGGRVATKRENVSKKHSQIPMDGIRPGEEKGSRAIDRRKEPTKRKNFTGVIQKKKKTNEIIGKGKKRGKHFEKEPFEWGGKKVPRL